MPNLIIPPRDLPDATDVFAGDSLVVDNGSTVSKATPQQIVDAGRPWATIQEAEEGTVADKSMSPLTTAAAISSQVLDIVGGEATFANYDAALTAAPSLGSEVLVIRALSGFVEVKWSRRVGGPCLGGGWEPADAFYSPLHFGAVGDGATDDGAAFNAALTAYRAKVEGVANSNGSLDLDLCGRVYVTTVSLDATGITSWGWGIKNGTIIGRCTGKTVLDLVGSRGGRVTDLVIYGDPANMPRVGIQFARASVGAQEAFCDNCILEHVMTRGRFSLVGAWFYGQETTSYHHCAFWNENPVGAAAFHVGTDAFDYNGVNPVLMQSDYLAPITGDTSYINNLYLNCDYRYLPIGNVYSGTALTRGATTVFTTTFAPTNFSVGQQVSFSSETYQTAAYGVTGAITAISGNNVTVAIDSSAWAAPSGLSWQLIGAQTGPTVVFGRGSDHNFTTCYIVGYGTAAPLDIIFGTSGLNVMNKINLDLLFEGTATSYIRFQNPRVGLGLVSSAITLYQVRATAQVMVTTAANVVTMSDTHISIPSARHRTPVVFHDPSRYRIVGGTICVYQRDRLARTGYDAFRTEVVDQETAIRTVYNARYALSVNYQNEPGDTSAFTQQWLDGAGALAAFSQYSFTTDAFLWSLNGTTPDWIMQEPAFYPNVDNVKDIGLSNRSIRRVYGQTYYSNNVSGKSGTFTTTDGKTITVAGGVITSIV